MFTAPAWGRALFLLSNRLRQASSTPVPPLAPGAAAGTSILSNLASAMDNVLIAGQLVQAARAAGVNFVGADADLGALAEFGAIVKARAGIDEDSRRIDGGGEPRGRFQVIRDDRFGVS